MHVRMGSEKMNCSILECYIVGNVGLRRTLINLCFIFNKCQTLSKYIKVNVSDFLLLFGFASAKSSLYLGCKYLFLLFCRYILMLLLLTFLNCG